MEDEEEEAAMGATRYPCMPSLIALQQMKNRLHLAKLGRKLMKWTALATGRELRKIAGEINLSYAGFTEDIRSGYIMLARSRYFNPNLNKMVIENISEVATITVVSTTKTISGVKVLHFQIVESGTEPYAHLSIEKGGQAVREAKHKWRDLLKRMIMMLELRRSFELIEEAHKSATKRMNVLAKVVIPRCTSSVRYILDCLDEMEREEFFRLKKILEVKYRKKKKMGDKAPGVAEDKTPGDNIVAEDKTPVNDIVAEDKTPGDDIVAENKTPCPVCEELVKPNICVFCSGLITPPPPPPKTEEEKRLEEYLEQLEEMLKATEKIEEEGLIQTSVVDFMTSAKQLKIKIDCCKTLLASKEQTYEVDNVCQSCQQTIKVDDIKCKSSTFKTEEHNNNLSADLGSIELGIFETEIEEITQIVRTRNPDGTIKEETRKITIIKEMVPTHPEEDDKNECCKTKSGNISNSTTIGIATVDNTSYRPNMLARLTKSELCKSSPPMVIPTTRSCISSSSLFELDRIHSKEIFNFVYLKESSLKFQEIVYSSCLQRFEKNINDS